MPTFRPRGFIFDMDGTIVDNMRFHDAAWAIWHERYGLDFDQETFFARTAGRTNPEIIATLMPHLTPDEIAERAGQKEELYRAAYAPHVAPLPGFTALLDEADAAGIGLSVATAAPPENVAVVLDTLGLRSRFAAVMSSAMGYRGKPHPDLFLAAAGAMGVPPEDCLVFEDAPLGLEAARRGGMPAIAVTTMLRGEAFAEFPNLVAAVTDFRDPAVRSLIAHGTVAA